MENVPVRGIFFKWTIDICDYLNRNADGEGGGVSRPRSVGTMYTIRAFVRAARVQWKVARVYPSGRYFPK